MRTKIANLFNAKLATAVLLPWISTQALALDITVNQMDYYPPGPPIGTPSFTDSEVRGDDTSTAPNLTPAVIDIDMCSGEMYSGPAGFFSLQWVARPSACFQTAGANTWDFTAVSGVWGGGSYNWNMSAGQFAVGLIFDWGAPAATSCGKANCDIPVLAVFEADGTPVDTEPDGEPGTVMAVGPFAGQTAAFSGGVPPIACQGVFFNIEEGSSLDININTDLLATCINVQGTASLDSTTQPGSGSLAQDGNTLTYTPNDGFNGLDSFQYTAADNANTASATVQVQVGGELQGNFTMLDSNGNVFGGTNDIDFTFDGSVDVAAGTGFNTDESDTNFGKLTIESSTPQPFNGFLWTAHSIRIFGPGTYEFDVDCNKTQIANTGCPAGTVGPNSITLEVGADQIGAHILFDWSTTEDIDVINVWERNGVWDRAGATGNENKLFLGPAGATPAEDAVWELVSVDANGDGINGAPMVDGPFQGFYANFNNKPDRGSNDGPNVIVMEQGDTELGDSLLASIDIYLLLSGVLSILGLRRLRARV